MKDANWADLRKAEIGLMIFKNAGGVSENTPISMTKRSQLIL